MNQAELPDAPGDADLDDFAASGRRRRRNAMIVTAVVVVALVGAVLISRANQLPALDHDTVADVREALDAAPAEYRPQLAARGFVELEGERLPGELLDAFKSLESVPPGMGNLVLLAPFGKDEESMRAWLLACPDGADAIAEVSREGGGTEALYERCKLASVGLLGASELGGVGVGELVATHAAWAYLVDHGSQTDLERRLLRAIMRRH